MEELAVLENGRGSRYFKAEEGREGILIANIVAQRIDREPIRANLYTKMEGPTQDMCDLAFDLFDRSGCIKDKSLRHPIKNGTGVWGEKLNRGEILLFEFTSVDREFRRQRIGKKLVQDICAKDWSEPSEAIKWFELAESEDKQGKFAILWPTCLNNGGPELDNLSPQAPKAYLETSEAEATSLALPRVTPYQ